MAEYVEQRMEKAIPALEEMKRIALYTDEEVRSIISKRTGFEYKIQRHETDRAHFLAYIDYEVTLIDDIRLRRAKYGIDAKKADIEHVLYKRVIKLYEQALKKFRNDIKLWFSLITFGTHVGYNSKMSEVIKNMLETHPKNADVWKAAAIWHLRQESIDEARKIILRGLQHNASSELLYKESFRLELMAQQRKIKEEEIPLCKSAVIVFETIIKTIKNAEFVCSLFTIADEYDKTGALQFEMIGLTKKLYPNSELVWKTMAIRELEGKHYDGVHVHALKIEDSDQMRLDNCLEVFNHAIDCTPTKLMWKEYIDCILDDCDASNSIQFNVLKDAYDFGITKMDNFLEENHYIKLYELTEDAYEKQQILDYGTAQFPMSELIWCELMCSHMKDGHNDKIERVFQKGIDALKENSLSLWKLYIKYSMIPNTKDKFTKVQKIYLRGISTQPENVAEVLRINYIEWLVIEKDLAAGRNAFLELFQKPSLSLVKKMIELESMTPRVNELVIRELKEVACKHFGTFDISVWMNLIKHQLRHDTTKVHFTHNTALVTLKTELRPEFERQYQSMRLSDTEFA